MNVMKYKWPSSAGDSGGIARRARRAEKNALFPIQLIQIFPKIPKVLFAAFNGAVFSIHSFEFFFRWEFLFDCQVGSFIGFFERDSGLKMNVLGIFALADVLIGGWTRFERAIGAWVAG